MRYDIETSYLTTRKQGDDLRRELEDQLRSVDPDEMLEIGFASVLAMTISFTDEFLGKLLSLLASPPEATRQVVLIGLNEETALEVDVCLGRRHLFAAGLVGDQLKLLGGDIYQRETFDAAAKRGEFRAADLAGDLDVSIQNVNNRLKKLVDNGAIARVRRDPEAGGREYLYRLPALCR